MPLHANFKSAQLRRIDGAAVGKITKHFEERVATIPNNDTKIKDIVHTTVLHNMSHLETIGVKDLTVDRKITASAMDVGGDFKVGGTTSSVELGGSGISVNPANGSTFSTKLTSKAELLANDVFAFDRTNAIDSKHVVLMDQTHLQFNDRVEITHGGLDVTAGNSTFSGDVRVEGTLRAAGELVSASHATTVGNSTSTNLNFSLHTIDVHKPLVQSASLKNNNQPIK